MSNYTFVELNKNAILHKYINDDGKRCREVVKRFPIELFVKARDGQEYDSVGVMGDKLQRVEYNSIYDANNILYSGRVLHGQENLVSQFISSRYNEDIKFDISKIRILSIDIETAYSTGFPTPSKADQEILSIACKVLGNYKSRVFGRKPCNTNDKFVYVQCDSERELLQQFQQYWRKVDCDIITGYNITGFDIPYIINRSNKIMGAEFTRCYSCFHNDTENCIIPQRSSYNILGVTALDYFELYKKYSNTTLDSYKLESVAQHELGVGKVNYEQYNGLAGLYEKNPDLFYEYNLQDALLIEQLESKLNFILLSITIAYIGKIKFSDIYSQVKFWDSHIYNTLRKRDIQIPPSKNTVHTNFVGAYVKEPVPGRYDWITTLDITSLYPSIIMSFNLSPETISSPAVHTIKDIDKYISKTMNTSFAKQSNVSVLANGATFSNNKLGIFPEVVKDMFNKRKLYKAQAIEAAKRGDIYEEATLNAKQYAFKIALNSLYGATASQYFRYNSIDIAEGITMTGQFIIRHVSNKLNSLLNGIAGTNNDYIIANDTDSIMFTASNFVDTSKDINTTVDKIDQFVCCKIYPFLDKTFTDITTYLNAYENMLSMKREVIADKGFWRGKKHYILQVWDKEGVRYSVPKLKMMGIETAKSSTPNIVRGSLETAIGILLNGDEQKLCSFVNSFKKTFFKSAIEDIAFPRGVTDIYKWVDKQGGLITGTPINVRACHTYNELLKRHGIDKIRQRIRNGDKIKFVYLKTPNYSASHVIAFIDTLPAEFELSRFVDKETQFEKTFLEPLKSFTDIMGWHIRDNINLEIF